MIEVRDFSKAYDSDLAVDRLTFHVDPGQVLGLIGPNGAGKTTTLRALVGIIPSSGGMVSIDGYNVDHHPIAVKKRTAYVPDDPQLFNDLTVEQHLSFTTSIYNVTDADEKIDSLIDQFELRSKFHAKAGDLSRGMRQKLALCCAYLFDPGALLLDEPMTGLDPRGIRTLKQSIADRAEAGAAVIISSHLLAVVEDICTHVLILDYGRSVYFGPIQRLRSDFASSHPNTSLEDIFFRAVETNAAIAE